MKERTKFVIGERVSVINDTMKGIVIGLNKDQINVECEDGFKYTFFPKELIRLSNWHVNMHDDTPIETSHPLSKSNSIKSSGLRNQVKEIDLHIHELVDSERGLTNHDKLKIQLNTARVALEDAMKRKDRKIVFIHGRGTGVLRDNLLQLLKNYNVDYQDASYLDYGNGATEVRIYQNKK